MIFAFLCYVARRKNIIAITTKDYSEHMHRTLAVNLTLTILITFHALCMHEHGMGTQKLILKERTVSQSATVVYSSYTVVCANNRYKTCKS